MVARIVLAIAVLNLLFLLTELSFNVISAGLPLD
jgi:hypothetical protein